MNMTGSQRLTPEAFAVEELRGNPELDYTAVRDRARVAGISLQPIHYGRARKTLGLPPQVQTRPEPTHPPEPVASSGKFEAPALLSSRQASPPPQPKSQPVPVEPPPPEDEPVAEDPSTDIVAPRRRGSPAFDFLLQLLRNEPQALYADLREKCAAKGFTIAPIMYGRAKAVLGLVPVRPRGAKAAAAARPAVASAPLQLKQVESVAADRFAKKLEEVRSVEQLVGIVKELDAERRRLRAVLEKVITLLDEALGP